MDIQLNDVWSNVESFRSGAFCVHQTHSAEIVPMHKHNKDQLIYTEGGVVHIMTEGNTWYLPARHYIWLPAGMLHSTKGHASVVMRSIYFEPENDGNLFYAQPGIYAVNDLLLEMIYQTSHWVGHISPENTAAYHFVKAMRALLPQLSREKMMFNLPSPKDARLFPVVDYLQKHINEPLKVAEIAKRFGFSERSLERLFISDIKISCINYLRTLRMISALELLSNSKLTISEIASKVGYESSPTFSNTFQQIIGMRPKMYARHGG